MVCGFSLCFHCFDSILKLEGSCNKESICPSWWKSFLCLELNVLLPSTGCNGLLGIQLVQFGVWEFFSLSHLKDFDPWEARRRCRRSAHSCDWQYLSPCTNLKEWANLVAHLLHSNIVTHPRDDVEKAFSVYSLQAVLHYFMFRFFGLSHSSPS